MKILTRFVFIVPLCLVSYTLTVFASAMAMPGLRSHIDLLAADQKLPVLFASWVATGSLAAYWIGAAGVLLFKPWARKFLVRLPVAAFVLGWAAYFWFSSALGHSKLATLAVTLVKLYAAVFAASAIYLLLPSVRRIFGK